MRLSSSAILAPIVFMTLDGAVPRSARADACVVPGRESTLTADADLTVHPAGEDPFGVRWLQARQIEATIPSKPGARTLLRVRGTHLVRRNGGVALV